MKRNRFLAVLGAGVVAGALRPGGVVRVEDPGATILPPGWTVDPWRMNFTGLQATTRIWTPGRKAHADIFVAYQEFREFSHREFRQLLQLRIECAIQGLQAMKYG